MVDKIPIATSHEVVMAAIEAAGSGLGEEFFACFADDLDFWFPGTTPISGRRKGLPAFIEYVTGRSPAIWTRWWCWNLVM